MEIKYDIKRGADTYQAIFDARLKSWILKGVIKRGEAVVWRSGLSGWRKPEELEELVPFFKQWGKQQLERTKSQKEQILLQKKKKKIKNILIIDDESDLCKILSRILSSKGYRTGFANTKKEGMASIKKEKPDLVVLDLKLPDGDGMELLPKIKKVSPEIAVIIISAHGNEESRKEAQKYGVYSFIDKPLFVGENILKAIKAIS